MNKEHQIPETTFSTDFINCNKMFAGQFVEWLFLPGMLFLAREKWWTGGSLRSTVHEGLDFCYYRNKDNQTCILGQFAHVPIIYPGVIISILDDFLGKSVFVAHHIFDNSGSQLHTLYGHLVPDKNCSPGVLLGNKNIVGAVADASRKKSGIPSHLHISVAWIPQSFGQEELNWQSLRKSNSISLIDPLTIISPDYSVITTLLNLILITPTHSFTITLLLSYGSTPQASSQAHHVRTNIKFQ